MTTWDKADTSLSNARLDVLEQQKHILNQEQKAVASSRFANTSLV